MVCFSVLINNTFLHYFRIFRFSFFLSPHPQLEPLNVTLSSQLREAEPQKYAHHLWGTRTNISMYNCCGSGVMTHFSKVAHC